MVDDRFRKLFALMWSDQPAERTAACNALVAHCRKLGLHPADIVSGTGAEVSGTVELLRERINDRERAIRKRGAQIAELCSAFASAAAAAARQRSALSKANVQIASMLGDARVLEGKVAGLRVREGRLQAALDLASGFAQRAPGPSEAPPAPEPAATGARHGAGANRPGRIASDEIKGAWTLALGAVIGWLRVPSRFTRAPPSSAPG